MSGCEPLISCASGGLNGCGGRLCIACRSQLKRYELLRYPATKDGSPDTEQPPEKYVLCGFTAAVGKSSSSSEGKLEIPGRTGGGRQGLRMTIVAADCEPRRGDRITVDGSVYRVMVMHSGTPGVAVLAAV